ncbi:hypothetical protein PRIPAC_81524 [Pristionchus pacificus]|uniref:G protein-coupled receptor n=1 Tax=Pristionchus pacificus TaxID=54126 RepID=A0A2A6CPN6_PRIPA|nr:hypothetical protein PRIPAC_81524 [Pristionchus pacificus]|eukprot:PDM80001.1 G protein-coupled receptor [Pristionchus pacificus]
MIMDHPSSPSTGFRMEQVGFFLDNNVTFKYAPTFAILHSIEANCLCRYWINVDDSSVMDCMECKTTSPKSTDHIRCERHAMHRHMHQSPCFDQHAVFRFGRNIDLRIFLRHCSHSVLRILLNYVSILLDSTGYISIQYDSNLLYEVQRPKTLLVVAGIFGAMAMYILWNTLQVIGVIRIDSIFAIQEVGSPLAGFTTLLSCIIYSLILLYNKYALRKRYLIGASSFYCLARTYQLRENVVMMEMILRIMGPAFVLCFPAFGLRALYHRLPKGPEFEIYRGLSVAMFDLWISILTAIMVIIFPLYNFRFRNTAANVVFYRSIVSLYNNRKRVRISSQDCAMSDIYFASLNRDLSNRKKQPCAKKISKYLQPDCNCKY